MTNSNVDILLGALANDSDSPSPRVAPFDRFVDTVSSPPVALDSLPAASRNVIDHLATIVFDMEIKHTIIEGSPFSGKSFLVEQLVHNASHYLQNVTSGDVQFVRISDISMEETQNSAGLVARANATASAWNTRIENICFVTDSPALAVYVSNALPLARVILEVNSGDLIPLIQHSPRSDAKGWRSWRIVNANMVMCTIDELVSLMDVTIAARLNRHVLRFQLDRKSIRSFIHIALDENPSFVQDIDGESRITLPPGVWATMLRHLVTNMTYVSDRELLGKNGKVSLPKASQRVVSSCAEMLSEWQEPDVNDMSELPGEMLRIMSAEGRPVTKNPNDDKILFRDDVDTLGDRLRAEIIGQDEAIDKIVDSMYVAAAGIQPPTKPVRSFLFLGPTGVGKTQISLNLAKEIAKSELNVIRIDMSEFQDAHESAKLFGAPPGYLGHDKGGILTSAVAANPNSILLLDEVEKAHPRIWDAFIQVLGSGRMTDSSGEVIDFTNTIVIMTSNVGAAEASREKLGFGPLGMNSEMTIAREKESVSMRELKRLFRPEFLNRIDEIVVFKPLTARLAKDIITKELKETIRLTKENRGVEVVDVSPELVDHLLSESDISHYGAREIQRVVFRGVTTPLARFIVHNKDVKKVNLGLKDNAAIVTDATNAEKRH